MRHPQRHKLAREPSNLRGSRVEFQAMGDRLATLRALLTFKVLNIPIYNACAVEECANVIQKFLQIRLSQKPRETVIGHSKNKGKQAKGEKYD